MKTVEEWLDEIGNVINWGWDSVSRKEVGDVIRQIQTDAASSDVPPGVLLDEGWIDTIKKGVEPFKGHVLQLLVSDGGARITRPVPGEDYELTAAAVRRGPGDYQTDEEWAWCRAAMCGLYTAIQNLPALLAERSRLLGLLRDLSLDGATERYNAGYEAGRKAALGELWSRVRESGYGGECDYGVNLVRSLMLDMEEPANA